MVGGFLIDDLCTGAQLHDAAGQHHVYRTRHIGDCLTGTGPEDPPRTTVSEPDTAPDIEEKTELNPAPGPVRRPPAVSPVARTVPAPPWSART